MAYQLPQRPHIASRWLTATLIGIYAIIIALVLLLSTDSNGSISPGKKQSFSGADMKHSAAGTVTTYSN